MAFVPRVRDGVRGVEIRVGGGTSIMPRLAPTLYEFVELDNGDYLKVTEACMRIFDRQDFLRVNRARARIKVLIDKIGIDAFREHGRGGARGRLGGRARLLARADPVRARRGGARAGRAPSATQAPTATCASSTGFLETNVTPQRQDGLLDRRGQGPPRRPHARAAPRPRPDHARVHAAAPRARRCTRTSCCAGSATSASTRSGSGCASSSSATPAPTRSPTSSAAPAPTPASSGSRARWASTRRSQERLVQMRDRRRADPPDPHQDERLPERLRPAPHRQHRLLRRLDQGRRAHDPGLHPAHRRGLRGRRRPLRPAAEGAAAGQARARGGRALGTLLRVRAQPTARSSTRSSSASARRSSRRGSRT